MLNEKLEYLFYIYFILSVRIDNYNLKYSYVIYNISTNILDYGKK